MTDRSMGLAVLVLTAAMLLATVIGVSPANAQERPVAEDIKSRLTSVDRYLPAIEEQPGESKACRAGRRGLTGMLFDREVRNSEFVRDLARQINRHGGDDVEVQIEFLDDVRLLDAHAAVGDNVRITGLGYSIGESESRVLDYPDTVDAQFELIRTRMTDYLDVLVQILGIREAELAERRAEHPERNHRALKREIAHLKGQIKAQQEVLADLSIDNVTVRGVELTGAPADVLASIEPDSIYSGAIRTDAYKMPSVIRRVLGERDITRAEAIAWLKKNEKAANRKIARVIARPDGALVYIEENC